MSSQSGNQIGWLEQRLAQVIRQLIDMGARLVRLEQIPWAAGAGGGGGGGGGGGYFGCTLSGSLSHGSSITGQTVWQLSSGSRSDVTTSGAIYNDGPTSTSDVASGAQIILAANSDGTWTVIGKYC